MQYLAWLYVSARCNSLWLCTYYGYDAETAISAVQHSKHPPKNKQTCVLSVHMCRVGQDHIYTVRIRYCWQGIHLIYGHIQRYICGVSANPTHAYSTICAGWSLARRAADGPVPQVFCTQRFGCTSVAWIWIAWFVVVDALGGLWWCKTCRKKVSKVA